MLKQCERCNDEHSGTYGSGRFCTSKCARSYATAAKRSKINKQVSEKLTIEPSSYICFKCKKEFISKRKNQKYCSRNCSILAIYKIGLKTIRDNPPNYSELVSQTYKNGKKIQSGGYTKWYYYKDIRVQGTYELRACKILDNWKDTKQIFDWEYTTDKLQYIGLDGKEHIYLLDFKVWDSENDFYYVETKGYVREIDPLKWKAVRKQGFNLEIWALAEIEAHEALV